ncbi:hypothetical protein FOA52_002246 [Chlamydomonas sp. UWO 241]|nr:hypothetical protein FOA52_002246 [Chlamydomonas sp. UWO 241]
MRSPVHEGCREIIGVHPCDRRRDTAVTSALFPGAHWSLVTDPVDTLWHPDVRETREEITARAREFMLHIMQRPERHIAIVTHSSFLNYLCKSFGADFSTHMQDGLHKWYENCEMRTYVLADTVHAPPRGPLHFHGGKACAASVAAAPA